MRYTSRRPSRNAHTAQGFSLVELSVVVAIISVVAVLGLESAANFITRTSGAVTRERLAVVDDSIARFFKIYGRLPCPARRDFIPGPITFGVEDCNTIITWSTDTVYTIPYGNGLMAGMVPYRTLNLPIAYASDGFGNKLNYVVTKNLTAAGVLPWGRFGTSLGGPGTDGIAGIEIRTGALEQPCNTTKCQVVADPASNTGAAYVVFSNGADQRGAVGMRASTASECVPAALAINDYYDMRIDSMNCQWGASAASNTIDVDIPKNVFYDSRFNAGMNETSYFDDYIVWRGKGQL